MNSIKSTLDLYFAAALISLGAKYIGADKTDPRNVEFQVSTTVPGYSFSSPHLDLAMSAGSGTTAITFLPVDQWEAEWVNGTLMVPAVRYRDALKTLKSVIHSR